MLPKTREEIIACYGEDIREYDDVTDVPLRSSRGGRRFVLNIFIVVIII